MAKCQTLEIFEVKQKLLCIRLNNIVQIGFKEHRCPILHWVASVSPDFPLLLLMMSPPGQGAGADVGHHGGDDAEQRDEEEDGEQNVVKQDQQLGQTHLQRFSVRWKSKIHFPMDENLL